MTGTIIKSLSGFYYVDNGQTVYQCRARGLLKKKNIMPTVGDYVEIKILDDKEAVIEKIGERKNIFIRPPVSNIDLLIIITAIKDPVPNVYVIDRMLAAAEQAGTEAVICVNKMDIADKDTADKLKEIYTDIYPIVWTSCESGTGVDRLKQIIRGKRAALTGPSGAGKSAMLNCLKPDAGARTGSVSGKTQRGRHTTRHVEMFEVMPDTFVYDTPGFTSFEVIAMKDEKPDMLYPEMKIFVGECKYDDCRHINEPGCRIKQAVSDGDIHKARYTSYVKWFEEIADQRKY